MNTHNKILSIIVLIIFTVLYLMFTSFPPRRSFSQLNITELNQNRKSGFDFSGHYEVDRNKKKPHKRAADYYNIKTKQTMGTHCNTPIKLQLFGPEKVLENQMFFLETSGRSKLSPRQACSVESAAKFSNLHAQVLLLSDKLDLTDNSTCYLHQSVSNVSFYQIDLQTMYENTPLQDLINPNNLLKVNTKLLTKVMP